MSIETREDQFNPNEPGFVDGLLDFECEEAITNVFRRRGFEATRDRVAAILNRLAEGRGQQQ